MAGGCSLPSSSSKCLFGKPLWLSRLVVGVVSPLPWPHYGYHHVCCDQHSCSVIKPYNLPAKALSSSNSVSALVPGDKAFTLHLLTFSIGKAHCSDPAVPDHKPVGTSHMEGACFSIPGRQGFQGQNSGKQQCLLQQGRQCVDKSTSPPLNPRAENIQVPKPKLKSTLERCSQLRAHKLLQIIHILIYCFITKQRKLHR